MIKKLLFALAVPFFTHAYMDSDAQPHTDWLDDLAFEIGSEIKPEWNSRIAERVMDTYLQKDAEIIAELEEKLKSDNRGMLAIMHRGAYYVELKAAQSSKLYHEKVARILRDLSENKTQREKFLDHLTILYKNLEELKSIQVSAASASTLAEKVRARARVVAQQLVIQARKALIKSSFLVA